MRIQNQPQTQYRYGYMPNFTATSREVREGGKVLYRNSTHFFSNDIKNWSKLADKIIEKYKYAHKVNSYCLGASKGDEVFGMVMLLIEKLGLKDAQKFFPFKAVDIDETMIKAAHNEEINVSILDINNIKNLLGENHKKYISFDYDFRKIEGEEGNYCKARLSPTVRNAVVFEKADASEYAKKIQPENTLVMARNFWPYLPSRNDQIKFSEELGKRLEKNSMCILGSFDVDRISADSMLLHEGFDICDVDYCYIKKESLIENPLRDPDFWMYTQGKKK